MYRDIDRAFWRLPYQFGHSKNVPKNFHVSKKKYKSFIRPSHKHLSGGTALTPPTPFPRFGWAPSVRGGKLTSN